MGRWDDWCSDEALDGTVNFNNLDTEENLLVEAPDKVCPFLSSIVNYSEAPIPSDKQESEFSNNEHSKSNKCVYKKITSNTFLLQIKCIGKECQLWDSRFGRCGAKTSDSNNELKNIDKHRHNQHDHMNHHKCSKRKYDCGQNQQSQKDSQPKMQSAVMETTMNDSMGQTYQYGKDYIVDDNDPNKPDSLKSVEESSNIDKESVTSISYNAFKEDNYNQDIER